PEGGGGDGAPFDVAGELLLQPSKLTPRVISSRRVTHAQQRRMKFELQCDEARSHTAKLILHQRTCGALDIGRQPTQHCKKCSGSSAENIVGEPAWELIPKKQESMQPSDQSLSHSPQEFLSLNLCLLNDFRLMLMFEGDLLQRQFDCILRLETPHDQFAHALRKRLPIRKPGLLGIFTAVVLLELGVGEAVERAPGLRARQE